MVEIEFYPIEVGQRVEDGKAVITLFGRSGDGTQLCVEDPGFEPYLWAIQKKGAIERLRERIEGIAVTKDGEKSAVTRTEVVEKKLLGKKVSAVKVFTALPRDIPVIKEEIEKLDALCYEYDIPFTRRYLIDKDMTPLIRYSCSGEQVTRRSRVAVLRAEKIEPLSDEALEKPRILAFDIETYNPAGTGMEPEKHPIVMVSFYGEHLKKVITWKRFKTGDNTIEFADSEAALLKRFSEVIESYRPDILTGYFSDGFDFPYLDTRARKYKISLDLGVDYSTVKVGKKGLSTTTITGIAHLDLYRFIRGTMAATLETDSYALEAVAEEILGEKKADVPIEELAQAWDTQPERLGQFCAYNLQDSKLTYRLATEILPNITELVKIVGLPLAEVSRMRFAQLVEWYLIRQAHAMNEIVPNKPGYDEIKQRRHQTYEGAFVFKPVPGIYEEIVVFDFRSLYPSIITAHNISPDTLNCSCCRDQEHAPEHPDYWFCRKKRGFISTVLEGIITRRMRLKEMMKGSDKSKQKLLNARQYALKTIGNSMYGYLGFFGARWYSLESAKSITAYGRYYIKRVIESAEKAGFQVIYSDTDSIFLTLGEKRHEDATKLIESINAKLPGIMELEYEGYYPRGIFVSVKEGDAGAKKKYALLTEDDGIKIRGFETIRRNTSVIAKETQRRVLEIILRENKPEKALTFVKNTIAALRRHELPVEKVIISTLLQKGIGDYDAIGPHVSVAQRMLERGIPVGPGSLIRYVVTAGKERIRDRARLPEEVKQDDYDPDYYTNNQILPAIEKIFDVLGYKRDELVESLGQSKLDSYFGKG